MAEDIGRGSTDMFDELADPLLGSGRAEPGTMMGLPCLRTARGDFFAAADRHTGDLIVKLPATRVDDLIDRGVGEPFAPAGRRFREWVSIPERDPVRWEALMADALDFVSGAES